jgi:integral membrane protein (TIGR01906 family)
MSTQLSARRQAWILGFRLALQLVIPLVLFLTSIRLTLTHAYVDLAYRVPGFPSDPYGFTQQDRQKWAKISMDYLVNSSGIDFLAKQHFQDGTPIYNQRELRHMADVKALTQTFLALWAAGLLGLVAFGAALWRLSGWGELWLALRNGALWTLLLMVGLALLSLVSFSFVFVGFHHLFFQGDTWLFLYSDTLIRLFPERFWQQVFGFLALVTLGEAGLLWWLTSRALAVRDSANLAYESPPPTDL